MNQHIQDYIDLVESGRYNACKWQHLLIKHVKRAFETEKLYVEEKRLENYLGLQKYFPFKLFPWQRFVFTLNNCTYKEDGLPRWPKLLLVSGRGTGKDGYLAFDSFAMTSPYNPIKHYNIDICAMNEEQAKQPFTDVWNVLEEPSQTKKLKRFWYWNLEKIESIKKRSVIKYRTNNPKGKDGLRSGKVIFNEIHAYENYKNFNVFTTGLGKKPEPRIVYATTNGDERDGPFDDLLKLGQDILNGMTPDNGLLPFLCILDDKALVHDHKNWEQANASLPYMPHLLQEYKQEYRDWKTDPSKHTGFMTKRMNIPDIDPEITLTTKENLIRASEEFNVSEIEGCRAYVGIDYAKTNDMASCGILVRKDDKRYWIQKSWFCSKSSDAARIQAPFREWEKAGDITIVDDEEIAPELITEWIEAHASKFNIVLFAIDNYRYQLMKSALIAIGVDPKENKNLKLIRPSDQMKIQPVINSWFINGSLIWGNLPLMRWAANNVKLIQSRIDKDRTNYTYGKQEKRSRKTDPFMALVHAACCELYDDYTEEKHNITNANAFTW